MLKSPEKITTVKNTEESPKSKSSSKEKSPKKKYELINSSPHSRNYDFFPKNTNEYRHLIDDIKCCKSDIEFMLDLRRYKNIPNIDKVTSVEPSFYQNDLSKYKNRALYQPEEKKY